MSDGLDFLKGMGVLLIFWIGLLIIFTIVDDTPPTNVTETVTYKDISHISHMFSDNNQYNIYTTNNSFKVSLEDYNLIKIGDNLTVEYPPNLGLPALYYNNHEYYAND